MAANRYPRRLLLFLLLVHLSDSSSLTTPSQDITRPSQDASQPVGPRSRAVPRLEDYDTNYEDPDVEPVTHRNTNRQPCNYDRCLDGQRPCHELAALTHCLCPGISSHLDPPEAPELTAFIITDDSVVAQWCAPYSEVTAYKVTVATGSPLEFSLTQRKGDVGKLAAGAKVCVVAVNNAGDSPPSCLDYEPPKESSGVALMVGLIGGALGFLLLLALAILLWKLKARRKARVSR